MSKGHFKARRTAAAELRQQLNTYIIPLRNGKLKICKKSINSVLRGLILKPQHSNVSFRVMEIAVRSPHTAYNRR